MRYIETLVRFVRWCTVTSIFLTPLLWLYAALMRPSTEKQRTWGIGNDERIKRGCAESLMET